MIFTGEIELCFWDPKRDLPPGKDRGVLYLLRRDLTELYGREDDAPSQTHKAPMLASIGMMTGLDLMSKLATNDLSGGRNIFKRFVENYGRLSPADAEVIYKLRCAQTHAYCLIDLDEKAKTEYCFVLIDDHPEHPLIRQLPAQVRDGYRRETYQINYWELKRFFLKCVGSFEGALRNPAAQSRDPLLTCFMLAMARVGKIEIS